MNVKSRIVVILSLALAFFAPRGAVAGSSGLVLHYTFDTNESPVVLDQSGNDRTAAISGAVWAPYGQQGAGMSFNGGSDDLHRADILGGMQEGTISLWVKPRTWLPTPWTRAFVVSSTAATYVEPGDGFAMGSLNVDGGDEQIRFGIYDYPARTWHWALSGEVPQTNRWTHFLGTWGLGGLRCYVDGTLRGTNSFSGAPPLRNLMLIGRSSWAQSGFDGIMDDFRVYNRALGPAEVESLCREGSVSNAMLFDVDGSPEWVGTSTPYAYGRHTFTEAATIGESVESPVEDGWHRRRLCAGWTGTGSVPASGTSNTVYFTIQTNSSVTWLWDTEYWIDVDAGGHGRLDVTSHWVAAGTSFNATALPDAGYRFLRWVGDVDPEGNDQNPITLTADRAKTVHAEFALVGADLQAGLLLQYSFRTNQGAMVLDESTNGLHASVSGAAWTTNGAPGGAMLFSGAGGEVVRSDVLSGLREGTVSLWMNARTWAPVQYLRGLLVNSAATQFVEPGDGLLLGTIPNGTADPQMCFGIYDYAGRAWNLAETGVIPQPNRWYHFMGTWGPGGLRCYVDGVLRGTHAYTGSAPLRSIMLIGRSAWPQSGLDGILDEVRIYDRALSDEEAQALYGHAIPTNMVQLTIRALPEQLGSPVPFGYGEHGVTNGVTIVESVGGIAEESANMRRICTGWSGTGDVPPSGTSTQVTFTIHTNSSLTWLWDSQYWVDIQARPHGRTDVTSSWFTVSNSVSISAIADSGYRFLRWTGDATPAQAKQNPLVFAVNRARSVIANFTPIGPDTQSGLRLHYTFDTNLASEVADESGNGLTGTLAGAIWVSNGVSGAAMNFNGSGADVHRADLVGGLGEGTVSLWLRPRTWDPTPYTRGLLVSTTASSYQEPGDGMELGSLNVEGGDLQIRFGIYDYPARLWHWALSSEIPQTNRWTHFLGTWGPGGVRCYVDGLLRGTNAFAGAAPLRNLLLIGRSSWEQSAVDGVIDDVRIYDRALDPEDVQELHRLGFDQDRDGLENWWEQQYFGSPTAAAPDDDSDSDGLSNRREFELKADPRNADTDGDGYRDGWEALRHSSLTDAADVPAATDHDFERDGSSDIGVTYQSAGTWYIRQSLDGALFSGGAVGWQAGAIPVPADYDGDGHCDFAGYLPGDGKFLILRSHDLSTMQVNMGWNGVVPVPADYDGDRMADPAIYAPEEGRWYIQPGGTGQVVRIDLGWKGVIPVPADYDGDRKADVAIYAPAEGRWTILESHNGAVRQVNHGWAGVLPVPGDYDGDGKADVAVYAAAESRWFVIQSSNSQVRRIDFGHRVAVPVPGDYDHDGRTDAALYVPSTGKWYILKSSDGQLLGGGTGAQAGIAWGRPAVTPAVTSYQVLKLYGLVP